jgi:ABC-type nitrate/sulfonate/bicarbonate transport system permease component
MRPFIGLITLLLIWQVAEWTHLAKSAILPPPADVVTTFGSMLSSGELQRNVVASLIRVAGGFAIASIVGIAIAVIMGLSRFAAEIVMPVIDVLRPISPIAWIPLAILWFGLGNGPSWFVIFVACFFPIVTNAYKGVVSVEVNHLRAAAICGMQRWDLVRLVVLPSAFPDIVAGLRTGLGIGWMAVIAAEFVSAQSGLGYQIEIAQQLFATPRVLVGMVTIGILGFLMNAAVVWLEVRITPWARTTRHAA